MQYPKRIIQHLILIGVDKFKNSNFFHFFLHDFASFEMLTIFKVLIVASSRKKVKWTNLG